ncbi:MAG: hypothetical protein AB1589_43200, partial [Cyanobacteriota bacterium]
VDDGDGDGWSPRVKLYADATKIKDEFDVGSADVAKLLVSSAAASLTGTATLVPASLNGQTLIISISGSPWQIITFVSPADKAAVVTQINAYFPNLASLSGIAPGELLVLSTANLGQGLATKGREAYIALHKNSTSLPNLFNNGVAYAARMVYGTCCAVEVGDEFWFDGALKGTVTRIISGGGSGDSECTFEISSELSESMTVAGKWFYFVSKNLSGAATPGTRPTPEVYVTTDGEVHIKQLLMRDDNGRPFWRYLTGTTEPIFYGSATIYLGYKALRKDVSAKATNPTILSFDTTTEIENEIGPITTDNPLAMGCYLAKLNCPGRTLYALGLDEISDAYPQGTLDAHARAIDLLADQEIYTIVPLTQDLDILAAWKNHVVTYSDQEYKMERYLFGGIAIPSRGPNKVVASGTDGEKVDSTHLNTNLAALSALLEDQGVDTSVADLTTPTDYGVYINIEQNALNYQIKSISGSIVEITLTTTDDTFYEHTTDFTNLTIVNEAFSVKIRGA